MNHKSGTWQETAKQVITARRRAPSNSTQSRRMPSCASKGDQRDHRNISIPLPASRDALVVCFVTTAWKADGLPDPRPCRRGAPARKREGARQMFKELKLRRLEAGGCSAVNWQGRRFSSRSRLRCSPSAPGTSSHKVRDRVPSDALGRRPSCQGCSRSR